MVFGRGRGDIVPGRGEQDRGALSDQVREDFLVAIAHMHAHSHALACITWAQQIISHYVHARTHTLSLPHSRGASQGGGR